MYPNDRCAINIQCLRCGGSTKFRVKEDGKRTVMLDICNCEFEQWQKEILAACIKINLFYKVNEASPEPVDQEAQTPKKEVECNLEEIVEQWINEVRSINPIANIRFTDKFFIDYLKMYLKRITRKHIAVDYYFDTHAFVLMEDRLMIYNIHYTGECWFHVFIEDEQGSWIHKIREGVKLTYYKWLDAYRKTHDISAQERTKS